MSPRETFILYKLNTEVRFSCKRSCAQLVNKKIFLLYVKMFDKLHVYGNLSAIYNVSMLFNNSLYYHYILEGKKNPFLNMYKGLFIYM